MAASVNTAQRLSRLEKLVAAREVADPLTAPECAELGDKVGASRKMPCVVEFRQLHQFRQRYAGRWIMVRGRYQSGFEMSALFAPHGYPGYDEDIGAQLHDYRALWVEAPVSAEKSDEIWVTGRFQRGPSGHLGQYFGSLVDTPD